MHHNKPSPVFPQEKWNACGQEYSHSCKACKCYFQNEVLTRIWVLMWEWCTCGQSWRCLCVRCRMSRRMELQTPALHHSRLLSFLLPNPRNERNWASIHRQRTPLQTRPTWLKRTVKYDHHTHGKIQRNTPFAQNLFLYAACIRQKSI